jgi:hypothetical protein
LERSAVRSRVLLLILLSGALVALLVFYRPGGSPFQRVLRPTASQVIRGPIPNDTDDPFRGDSSASLAELRARVTAKYRLLPDRRFLMAVSDLQRWITGSDSTVRASFQGGRWEIRSGTRRVGTLPECPGFGDLEATLASWARELARERGFTLAKIGRPNRDLRYALDRLDAIGALEHANQQWARGRRDVALARRTTQALTLLTLQTVDQVGAGERVPARALAALALTRAFTDEPLDREEALLADAMGYHAFAEERGSRLVPRDPVRCFVVRDDSTLFQVSRDAVSLEGPYLYLIRLARMGDLDSWQSWAVHRFGKSLARALPVLATGLESHVFAANLPAALRTLEALAQSLESQGFKRPSLLASLQGRAAGELIDEFERVVATTRAGTPGAFLDDELLRAHDRAIFYTSMERIGSHYRNSLSSPEATQWFSDAAAPTGDSRPARAFHAWYQHLAQAMSGRVEPADLMGDLAPSDDFGGELAIKTYEALSPYVPLGDPALRTAASRLAARLDTRPTQMQALAGVLREDLTFLSLAEDLYLAAAAGEGHHNGSLLAFCAAMAGDRDSLEALMASGMRTEERAEALVYLVRVPGMDAALIDRSYQRLMAEAPNDWAIVQGYASWLEEQKQLAKARAVVESWLEKRGRALGGFPEIFATTRVAHLYYLQGLYDQGLKAIGDLDQSQQLGIMRQKALLLAAAKRPREAEELARAALKRYPHVSTARATCAEVLWTEERFDPAAKVLAQAVTPLTAKDWATEVAPAFARVFGDHPRQGLAAAQALVAAGFSSQATIGTIPRQLAKSGHGELAFEIQKRLAAPGLEQLEIWTKAYEYLKDAKGAAEALAWLERTVPAEDRENLALFAHQEGCDELLWSFASASQPGTGSEYLWLLRAAASLRDDAHPHRAEITNWLEINKGNYYLKVARYLAGLETEPAILSIARDSKRRCEVYYFVGFKAMCEGRVRDAADWFTMSVETGAVNNGESRWSSDQLWRWMATGQSLKRLGMKRGPS